jgi:hypothetical protein
MVRKTGSKAALQKSRPKAAQEILEQGDIYFLYRPKVRSADDAAADEGEPAPRISTTFRTSTWCSSRRAAAFA